MHAHHAWMGRYDPDGARTVVASWSSTGTAVPVGNRADLGGRNLSTLVFHTGQPARIDDYADASGPAADVAHEIGLGAGVGVPISVEGRQWGVMVVASAREPLPAGTEARLARFTELAATGIANAQAQAEVAASRARIVAAADETRRRIERDLHDGVQQRLVIQALMLSGIRDRVPADARAEVDEVRDELAATRQELRDLCQGVHPAILVEAGLGAAIRALARRSPLPVRVQMRADGRLPYSCEVTAYYVAAEAFTNAAKHAKASAVDILIEEAGGTLTVQVRDDGAGGADASGGSGLTGLRGPGGGRGRQHDPGQPGRGRHRTDRAAPRHRGRSLTRTGRGAPRATYEPTGDASRPGKGHPTKITNDTRSVPGYRVPAAYRQPAVAAYRQPAAAGTCW